MPWRKRHTVIKNAIDASAVGFSMADPLKDRRMATIIIEIAMPNDPNIIGFLRPNRSRPKDGTKEPTTNENSTHPETTRAVVLSSPTFCSSTVGA